VLAPQWKHDGGGRRCAGRLFSIHEEIYMHTAVLDTRTTTATPTTKKRSVPLDPQVADRLLDLLSSDDEFRLLFQRNPTSALASIGHAHPAEASDFCLPISDLAPKEHFIAAHEELKLQVISAAALTNPHCYEAGQTVPHLLRK